MPAPPSVAARATAGAAAAAVSIAVSELLTGLLGAGSSLVEAIGELIIDISPEPVTRFAIAVFGLYDKLALIVGIVVVSLALGAVLGILSSRASWVPMVGFAAFGAFGAYAGSTHPDLSTGLSVFVASISAIAGLVVLGRLLGLVTPKVRRAVGDAEEGAPSPERRALLVG
ncbi:MAG: molybdopterin-binding oxidoreductase, partial [Acidimicrobiia bacterium]